MALAGELELDAVVDEPLAVQPLSRPGGGQEVDDALLDHACADARLDVLAAPVLEDDRVDALQVEQMAEREAGGAGADDPDLRAARLKRRAPRRGRAGRWRMRRSPRARRSRRRTGAAPP